MNSKKRMILGILSILFVLTGCKDEVITVNQPEIVREEIQNECGIDDRHFELEEAIQFVEANPQRKEGINYTPFSENNRYEYYTIGPLNKDDLTYSSVVEKFPYYNTNIPVSIYCDYDEESGETHVFFLYQKKYYFEIWRRYAGEDGKLFESNWWGIEQMISDGLKQITGLEKEFEIIEYHTGGNPSSLTVKYTGEVPFYVDIRYTIKEVDREEKIELSWSTNYYYVNVGKRDYPRELEQFGLYNQMGAALHRYVYQEEYQAIYNWALENDLYLYRENDEPSIYMFFQTISFGATSEFRTEEAIMAQEKVIEWYHQLDSGEELNLEEIREYFEDLREKGYVGSYHVFDFHYGGEDSLFVTKEKYLELLDEFEQLIVIPGTYQLNIYPGYGGSAVYFEGEYIVSDQRHEIGSFDLEEDGTITYKKYSERREEVENESE